VARAKFINDPAFEAAISKAAAKFPEVAEAALRAGASVIADEMKKRLKGVLSPRATGQLVASFGITPVKQDREFNFNVHLGFDGYRQPGYGRFEATGVPFQLIARSIENGAGDWRPATPFAKPAVQATKAQAFAVMTQVAEEELEKIMKER
jgi:hypothetical protein